MHENASEQVRCCRQPGMVASGSTHSMTPGPSGAPSHVTPHTENTFFSVCENTSFHGMEICTPAAREGFRAEAMTPSNSPVSSRHQPVVCLTPAACKYLHAFAAKLRVIAHYQQYEPHAVLVFDRQPDALPHLAKVLLAVAALFVNSLCLKLLFVDLSHLTHEWHQSFCWMLHRKP